MSVRDCQRVVDSAEFAGWMAFYVLEDEEADPNRPPSREQLAAKMAAFAAAGSARPGDRTMERRG